MNTGHWIFTLIEKAIQLMSSILGFNKNQSQGFSTGRIEQIKKKQFKS